MRSRIIIILLQIREIGATGRGGGNLCVCVLDKLGERTVAETPKLWKRSVLHIMDDLCVNALWQVK